MLKESHSAKIPAKCRYGEVYLTIAPLDKDAIYINDNPNEGESSVHLVEGSRYQYELTGVNGLIFQLFDTSDIVYPSLMPTHQNMGTLHTGLYVGTLTLTFGELGVDEKLGQFTLEVRSVKTDYETDYRQMLDDIAAYYTDLVLMQGSPVTQHLETDVDATPATLYQKFCFVRSLVDSEAFAEAVHKVIANPVSRWTEMTIPRSIVSVRRFTRQMVRQLASGNARVTLPENARCGLPSSLCSVPRKIDTDCKRDTLDNKENRFVKFALRTFLTFCSELKAMSNASNRLKHEAEDTIRHLESWLNTQFFRHVSDAASLNMNSPVLQRKEGYREIMQAWLLFDLAARLNWKGGNDVYEAGKKNVAVLYEYWLFFKLQELMSNFFDIEPAEKAALVTLDDDGINLDVVQGRMKVLRGKSVSSLRTMNVAFYYNRTFNGSTEEHSIKTSGSWTTSMRPDYTLSLWPGDISEAQAEEENLIVHIHFDAKYRLNKALLDDSGQTNAECTADALTKEKNEQEKGIYKRADLLKMHAYKDAIRRTSGAYVLYPGTENRTLKGFHEIIPGLGAFSIRPGHWAEDSLHLKIFLAEVKAHMLDRASQREKLSYYQQDIHKRPNSSMVFESLPEPAGENRDLIPDETYVILAFYKNEEHLNWIRDKKIYNMRAGDSKGSMKLTDELIKARYILLHDGKVSLGLIKLAKEGPKVYNRQQLIAMGYPVSDREKVDEQKDNANKIYLLFSLCNEQSIEKELSPYKWEISKLSSGKKIFKPQTFPLSELIKKAYKE